MNKETAIKYIFIIFFSIISRNAVGQEESQIPVINPPINTEVLVSNRGLTFQMIIDKKISSIPKLGFFSVTSLVGEWGEDQIGDYMTQASLTYELVKGLKLAGGFHVTPVKGMRPILMRMVLFAVTVISKLPFLRLTSRSLPASIVPFLRLTLGALSNKSSW